VSPRCGSCDHPVEADWSFCPHCGRAPTPKGTGSHERIVRIVGKVAAGLLDAGLLEAAADAEERGDVHRAAQLEIARKLARDVLPLVAEAAAAYLREKEAHEARGGAEDGSGDPEAARRGRPARG
jgi:hypothetical protein